MIKKALALLTSAILAVSIVFTAALPTSAASGATGVGLAEHAMNAYFENWSYVYGGSSAGAVDCSGLFVTYKGVGGIRTNLLGAATNAGLATGSVSNGIPRIHGLGLWQPGHVGIYVGSGMAVDARDESSDMVYHSVSSKNWQKWFKVVGVNYPTTGWQTFLGKKYYYENGQYIVNCTRIIDGKEYTFNSSGVANGGSPVSEEAIAAAKAEKEAKEKAAAEKAAAEKAAAEKAAAEKAAAEKKAKEEAEKKKAEEEAAKAKKEAEAKKKAEEEAKKKAEAAAAKKEAEETASEQGSQLAQSLLMETVPLEQKNMPKVKAAVVPEAEQAVPENAGAMAFVIVLAVFISSGMFFLVYRMKHIVQGRSYVPASDLAFVKQISRRMEKALTEKAKKLLKK